MVAIPAVVIHGKHERLSSTNVHMAQNRMKIVIRAHRRPIFDLNSFFCGRNLRETSWWRSRRLQLMENTISPSMKVHMAQQSQENRDQCTPWTDFWFEIMFLDLKMMRNSMAVFSGVDSREKLWKPWCHPCTPCGMPSLFSLFARNADFGVEQKFRTSSYGRTCTRYFDM